MDDPIETQFLIVGAGPAGASLACFLTMYGLKGMIIASASGTANTPRAHITNVATMECLRDLGIEEEVMKLAHTGSVLQHVRWCESLAGEEYGRVYGFGNAPDRKGEYEHASPSKLVDIPQTLLEPILIRHATTHGFTVRFDTTLLHFEEAAVTEKDSSSGTSIVATVRDELTKREYRIRTKYLFGADGARSKVAKQINLPMVAKPGGGMAINLQVKADLSHLMEHRPGNLHWIMQPGRDDSKDNFGTICVARMVKPWNEWLFTIARPALDPSQGTASNLPNEAYLDRIKEAIGDDTPVEIQHASRWFVNETYAETYSKGNVFCLGDAVHRHPPSCGLGSNTSIQDAYNLAWKIAYVEAGLATPSLLDSYSLERQPVGEGIVTRANDAWRDNAPVWEALGTLPQATNPSALVELKSLTTPEGDARRARLREALAKVQWEYNGLGAEMGQHYVSSGIYLADDEEEFLLGERATRNPILHHEPSTYPGRRLPHVWLNSAVPKHPISIVDLAGHGKFSLFTGRKGGQEWKEAAGVVGKALGLSIEAHSIGFRQDWEDVYYRWEELRGVDESGAVLVRPDRFVAWRAKRLPEGGVSACAAKLEGVMRSILGLEGTK
ncbi:FAD binding domain-containing protein [Podospora didyma]|uniref:FAD binding domain-containing protein n=1 Tax=Podospora didyma TaxID=330526 RepID=A0AAE0NUU7_9PEZI|nr:FAD binding domain-containing protein [Podospora didyma]